MGLVQKKKKKTEAVAETAAVAAPNPTAKLTAFQKALIRDGGW